MNQRLLPRLSHLLASLALGAGLLACESSSATGPDGTTKAKGVPAQVVYVTHQFWEGQRFVDSTVIDSASGRWSFSTCGPRSATGASCGPRDFLTHTGTVQSFLLDSLFARARRADFEELQRYYRGISDVSITSLQIVQNGRRRAVMWEGAINLPPAVRSFQCRIMLSLEAQPPCDW